MFLEKNIFILLLLVYCFIVYNYSNNSIILQKEFTLLFTPLFPSCSNRNDLSIWTLRLSPLPASAKQNCERDGDPGHHEKQI